MKKVITYISEKMLHGKLSDKKIMQLSQFIQFGIVGLSNTLISYLVYVVCIASGMNYLLSNVFGFCISVVNAFYWNNKYVFKRKDTGKCSLGKAFFKTFIAYAGSGLILSNILLVLWVSVLHISKVIAPIISLLITIPLNYILNKYWAFKER